MTMTDATTLDAADEADFRRRCREFLEANARTLDPEADHELGSGEDEQAELARTKAYQRALADAGLAGLGFPKEFGGAGLGRRHQEIWREEASRFAVPTRLLAISHGMCLPVMAEFGTDEQKREHLGRLIAAEEVWAQMFSEPGAGSDVASLQTRAVKDGDEWILNGQKVWTTYAHLCDKGLVVARTNPDAPKHAGLSMFIVDLTAPGVEVRPLRQINGEAEFNEVFFTDVRLPLDALVGPLDDGWRVATAMLMYERVSIGSGSIGSIRHPQYDALVEEARARGANADPTIRQRLADLYIAEVCQSLIGLQTQARAQSGQAPGPGGSLGKLLGALISAKFRDLSIDIVGPAALAWEAGDAGAAQISRRALGTLASSIAGGTNEIQKNIIGERVLGLPREPAVDKGVPFKDLKVGTQKG